MQSLISPSFAHSALNPVAKGILGVTMAQVSNALNAKKSLPLKLRIKVPKFDNKALIEGYSKTLIGRCMNPKEQRMGNLLLMLPKIWNLEERVSGADLGFGVFQFDFDEETDIAEVLKMEPFHFDRWMLSVVRWEPVIEPNYPSAITFWVRVLGIPLHFWADETFRAIGEALGEVKEVDLDSGKIQVVVDGFKPLCFETEVEFDEGIEVPISLRYERLFGYCRLCFSLCHDVSRCPKNGYTGDTNVEEGPKDPKQGLKPISYKAAVDNGYNRDPSKDTTGHIGSSQSGQSQKEGKVEKRFGPYGESQGKRKQNGWGKQKGKGKMGDTQISDQTVLVRGENGEVHIGNMNGRGETNQSFELPVTMSHYHSQVPVENMDNGVSLEEEKSEKLVLDAPLTEQEVGSGRIVRKTLFPIKENSEVEEGEVTGIASSLSCDKPKESEKDLNLMVMSTDQPPIEAVDWKENKKELFTEVETKGEGNEAGFTKVGLTSVRSSPSVKKKGVKGSSMFIGAASKKRIAQNIISPRKKVSSKNNVRIGEGLYNSAGVGGSMDDGGGKPNESANFKAISDP